MTYRGRNLKIGHPVTSGKGEGEISRLLFSRCHSVTIVFLVIWSTAQFNVRFNGENANWIRIWFPRAAANPAHKSISSKKNLIDNYLVLTRELSIGSIRGLRESFLFPEEGDMTNFELKAAIIRRY